MTLEVDRHLFVILGATGDLTHRKLLPSLYRIITENAIGHRCIVMGAAINEMDDHGFRALVSEALAVSSLPHKTSNGGVATTCTTS